MILTSLLVNILRNFKANSFARNQFLKIDFLYFQLVNVLAQDFHVIHMNGPHEPLAQVHWRAENADFRMKSILKVFSIENLAAE